MPAYKIHYKTEFQGLPISIENRRGSYRRGTDPDGNEWKTKMYVPYGYIRMSEGTDGDHLDCFLGEDEDSGLVVVVHIQNPETQEYDEDKVFLGFETEEAALDAFKKHYDDWTKFYQDHDVLDIIDFRKQIHEAWDKKKPIRKMTPEKVAWLINRNIEKIAVMDGLAREFL